MKKQKLKNPPRKTKAEIKPAGLPWALEATDGKGGHERANSNKMPFDSLSVGTWFHLERMDEREWHMLISTEEGISLRILVQSNGRAVVIRESGVVYDIPKLQGDQLKVFPWSNAHSS
jgi:hypothetical protein